jgi:hypothetical protein
VTDVERLLAYEEIRQLAARYSVYADARDLDRLVDLFVPRRTRRSGPHGPRRAPGRLRPFLPARSASRSSTSAPTSSTSRTPDHATGIAYARGEIQDGGLESPRFIIHAIQYHDTYARRDGRWLFVRRKHFLVYGAELGVNPLGLPPANWPASQTGLGSHPQALETWRRFWSTEE